jgi:hypothetical protein
MDPVANLQEQIRLAHDLLHGVDLPDRYEISNRLAELVLALDEWRRSGGFDPYTKPEDEPALLAALRTYVAADEEALRAYNDTPVGKALPRKPSPRLLAARSAIAVVTRGDSDGTG